MKRKSYKTRNINVKRWDTTYQIKRESDNVYNVNRRVKNNKSKIISVIVIIILLLMILTALYYLFRDNDLMASILTVSDSYIFIGLTTFIIFLVFNGDKKEYNGNKKGVK